ncbi:MAG: transposase [Candidatus Saccharibacteria bacterium]
MPSKNVVKQYNSDSYYHIYSRGVNKEIVFREPSDYIFFLGLFKRYLSKEKIKNGGRIDYPKFDGLKLVSYCLMPTHIHILVYQVEKNTITRFMRSLMTSYSMYFNKKYDRFGPLFQSTYKATLIDQESYLHHISRYIHLNTKNWRTYPYSSFRYFMREKTADWIDPQPIIDLFDNKVYRYLRFVEDYEDQKSMLDELKWELANSDE